MGFEDKEVGLTFVLTRIQIDSQFRMNLVLMQEKKGKILVHAANYLNSSHILRLKST